MSLEPHVAQQGIRVPVGIPRNRIQPRHRNLVSASDSSTSSIDRAIHLIRANPTPRINDERTCRTGSKRHVAHAAFHGRVMVGSTVSRNARNTIRIRPSHHAFATIHVTFFIDHPP